MSEPVRRSHFWEADQTMDHVRIRSCRERKPTLKVATYRQILGTQAAVLDSPQVLTPQWKVRTGLRRWGDLLQCSVLGC